MSFLFHLFVAWRRGYRPSLFQRIQCIRGSCRRPVRHARWLRRYSAQWRSKLVSSERWEVRYIARAVSTDRHSRPYTRRSIIHGYLTCLSPVHSSCLLLLLLLAAAVLRLIVPTRVRPLLPRTPRHAPTCYCRNINIVPSPIALRAIYHCLSVSSRHPFVALSCGVTSAMTFACSALSWIGNTLLAE